MLKYASWFVSALLHVTLVLPLFIAFTGGEALQSGEGEDQFVVEQTVTFEGFDLDGADKVTVAEIETPESQLSEARPELEEIEATEAVEERTKEIEAAELPEETEVIESLEGPEQEAMRPEEPEREEVKKPQPKQVAQIELPDQVSVKEQRSSGPKQSGGKATLLSAYRGKLRMHIGRHKVYPRSKRTGTVVVKFSVGASGELLSRRVTKSSGHRVLDEAAMASLDRAAPFPAFSKGMPLEPVTVSVPFKFILR